MQVGIIEYGSPAYQQELALRNRLLRMPLGLDVYDEDLQLERGQWHYGLFDGDLLIGCVVVVPLDNHVAKIRQMAIDGNQQGAGHGRLLLEAVEGKLLDRGVRHLTLNARIEAVGFYAKLGYATVGDQFLEVGIPHQSMEKGLH